MPLTCLLIRTFAFVFYTYKINMVSKMSAIEHFVVVSRARSPGHISKSVS
jgi:hypothetical protein